MNVRRHFIAMKLFRRLISEAVLAMTAYWISPPFKRTNNATWCHKVWLIEVTYRYILMRFEFTIVRTYRWGILISRAEEVEGTL